jgi:hypothetical protein
MTNQRAEELLKDLKAVEDDGVVLGQPSFAKLAVAVAECVIELRRLSRLAAEPESDRTG